jgi:hypothetical protein
MNEDHLAPGMKMKRIEVPDWAPSHARCVIKESGKHGNKLHEMAGYVMESILAQLDRSINSFVNDPNQCYVGIHDRFPIKERLSGEYYIGGINYFWDENMAVGHIYIEARCLELEYSTHQRIAGYDYLGLENMVVFDPKQGSCVFSDDFNISSI